MKTVFSDVPDVPVSKFVLNMKGGKKGLLVNSRDLCGRPQPLLPQLQSPERQELKVKKLPLRTPGCRKARKKRHKPLARLTARPAGYRPAQVRKPVAQLAARLPFCSALLPRARGAGRRSRRSRRRTTRPNEKDGWQAGTCNDPDLRPGQPPKPQFYETAAGHPPFGITQFIIKHKTELLHEEPEVDLKTLRVDLPVGLSVNPGATPQCDSGRTPRANARRCSRSAKSAKAIVTVSPEAPLLPPVADHRCRSTT